MRNRVPASCSDPLDIKFVRAPLLGIEISPLTRGQVVDRILEPTQQVDLILNHNLHSVYMFHQHKWFRQFYAGAAAIIGDGWPIVWSARLGPTAHRLAQYRVGSTDWLDELGRRLASGNSAARIFVLGSNEENNIRAQKVLRSHGQLTQVSGHHGYLQDEAAEETIVKMIHEFAPTLVLVGLGMPIQESFLSRHEKRLPPAHYATVGGAIDYLSGAVALAPRWIGSFGLEWLWRFLHDPRRLFARYFVEPARLAAVLVAHHLNHADRSVARGRERQ